MSGCTFITKHKGNSLQNAYKNAVAEAESEHGHEQGYSGAINSTNSLLDYTRKFKESKQPLPKYINFILENAAKRDCYAICLSEPKSNPNKVKSKVEHIVNKGTAKWILKYVVYEHNYPLRAFTTKGDAVKFARTNTEKTGRSTNVVMEKMLEKGSPTVAIISYKQSSKEKPGEWIFFGVAPD